MNLIRGNRMQVNASGMALIENFEGCRTKAYQDCVGIWTIGYGHTSSAGPPTVVPGMMISKDEALAILKTDVGNFSKGVEACLRVPLNDNQLSALVSFAYNIGLSEFRKSSVLQAVNAGEFHAVPAFMAMWIKAGGKVVPGLVARRAAEGALFCQSDDADRNGTYPSTLKDAGQPSHETAHIGRPVESISGTLASRHTVLAAVVSSIGAVVSSAARHLEDFIGQHLSLVLEIAAVAAILSCAAWLLHEHYSRFRQLST
jgi:lysozyme